MYRAFRRSLPALLLALGLVVPHTAQAHSLGSRGHLSPPLKAYFEEIRALSQDLPDGTMSIRGVLDQFKLWQVNIPIKLCFNGGEQALRMVFVETSLRWTPGTSLKLDFGQAPGFRSCSPADAASIRISFSPGVDWSFIGTDSLAQKDTTLNIAYAADTPLGRLDRKLLEQLILHEMGHALGFEHEHQSPASNCDQEFDWPKVEKVARTQWGWTKPNGEVDKEAVEFNLRVLTSSERLRLSPYDRESIMHYYFEPELFKRGRASPCFVGHNQTLSTLDKQMAREAYPADAASQNQHLQQRANAASATLAPLQLNPRQLSRVGRELTRVLGETPRKIVLDFGLARASGQAITRGSGDFEICEGLTQGPDRTETVACEVATDGSALLIAVQAK
jgi:hypothetical protein